MTEIIEKQSIHIKILSNLKTHKKETIHGWLFTKTGVPLQLIEKAAPHATPNHVVIDIKATGLCHSDVAALQDPGWMPLFPNGPVIMGHECAGVISEVGEGVTDLKVGDRVGVNPMDRDTRQAAGYNYDGGYATKVLVPAKQCVIIPDSVTFVEGAAATDAGITAYHALFSIGQAKPGMKVGIIGVGGLGQFAAQMAMIKGCEVYASDVSPEAIKLAEKLGCKKVYKSVSDMKEAECELIVDFAGFGKTTADALDAVKSKGTVVIVGMGILNSDINTYLMITKELKLLGSNGGTVEDLEGVYECFSTGKMSPQLTTIPFEEIDKGLERLKNHEVTGRLVAVFE